MGTTQATPTAAPEKVTKTYTYFDLTTFEQKSKEVTVDFVPPADFKEAMQRIENDSEKALAALTAYLRKAALKEGRAEVLALGAPKSIVLTVIRPFRNLPPYSKMTKIEDGKSVIDRAAQTKALLDFVRGNAGVIEVIRNAALAAADEDEDGSTEEQD